MQLTGKQIFNEGVITNIIPEAIQQQGVDCRLRELNKLSDEFIGTIYKDHTEKPEHYLHYLPDSNGIFYIEPGYYEVIFEEGCDLPNNRALRFKSRSSLVRCGASIHCGQFDAGFKTEHMGCFMRVDVPIRIEQGARIAQAIVFESYPVEKEDLYNGQWQNDKQRNV